MRLGSGNSIRNRWLRRSASRCRTHRFKTKVRVDPAHPPKIDENYPDESRRSGEEGICKVKLTVYANGDVGDVSLTLSTGYPRLDEACLKAFLSGGLLPATEDGIPVSTTLEIPITWKLSR
jgi:TonB family protein